MGRSGEITAIDQLPIVLKTDDVMRLIRCSRPWALEVIRKGEKKGWFRVLWVGNSPRINRDAFLEWFENGEKRRKEVTA